jgi:hypothetical protein
MSNYSGLQGISAASNFTFNFNSTSAIGDVSNYPNPYIQIGIINATTFQPVYISPFMTATTTSFTLGANTLQSGTNYIYFVNDDTRQTFGCSSPCSGTELSNYTFGTFSTAAGPAVPQTLVNLQGGSDSNPVVLPRPINQIGAVSGVIGAYPDLDFYEFAWNGGQFTSTATLQNADSSAYFYFALLELVGNQFDMVDYLDLSQTNNFNGTLSDLLSAGTYEIGLYSYTGYDPAYTINFDSSQEAGAAVPEPDSLALLAIGAVGLLFRLRRRIPCQQYF